MAEKIIKSVELLPEFLQTTKNSKFLASTIDQLIQKPQLERIEGYIGSTNTPTYTATDVYITETLPLRRDYQLNPALVVKDINGNVNDVVALDDLINEINLNGGSAENFDRIFRSEFYSYDPGIDWDKFVNYQEYYWLVNGPDTITIETTDSSTLYIDVDLIGKATYTSPNGVTLSNGMKIQFGTNVSPESYQGQEYFVEGVGTSIVLVDSRNLTSNETFSTVFSETFDSVPFDEYPFDGYKQLPINPEYITINRASPDLNPWSRYNRWVHKDIITTSALLTGQQPVYPTNMRAKRPIIEFAAGMQLYNFGSKGIGNVDLIDSKTTNAFNTVEGSAGYYIDGVLLEQGHKVIFTADTDSLIRNNIYEVVFVDIAGQLRLTLQKVETPSAGSVIGVNLGTKYAGTSWWYDGTNWNYSQQHTSLNQAPLFDLFDDLGNSYSDTRYYSSNFKGSQIFGYSIGSGTADLVLGFPLQYRNSVGVGTYLFNNYFMTDTITISTTNQTVETISTGITYFKINDQYFNVWKEAVEYPIPVLTSLLTTATSEQSYYETPLGLTNNPLNGPIPAFTLSEITDHVSTMANRDPDFIGVVPGDNNLRDLADPSSYGTRFISNINPIAFAHLFIGKKEHSVVDAVTKVADQYNQYKLSFLRKISNLDIQTDPITAVDTALTEINFEKDLLSPYYLSDMIAYGTDKITKTWTVTNTNSKIFPITSDYDPNALTLRSVLVYLNGIQLIRNRDYQFIVADASVEILVDIAIGDTIVINDYTDTKGSFVPPTPSKLGLYPKFTPSIYVDNTYVTPTTVIQGHDGSIMVAYNDYRDLIILEFETRIYNNIKAEYRSELLDINSVLPGAFRNNDYTQDEIKQILVKEFIKWTGLYNVDYVTNTAFNETNPFTWNYTESYNNTLSIPLAGSWRAIYKHFYDTDRPDTCPWEMLGFSEEPEWWTNEYGPAPYTSGNDILWGDLEQGIIKQGSRAGVNSIYARPQLSQLLPVDDSGKLVDPTVLLASDITPYSRRQPWVFGDQGAAETAWRRSSYWPFVVQKLIALTKSATYASLMYDPIRINKNIAGQWTYGSNYEFLNLQNVYIQGPNNTLTSGYSVFVSEVGRQRTGNYDTELQSDLSNLTFNLFYKVGGFVNKSKIQIIIDAIDPTSTSPGALLNAEDYNLILNVSNPIKSSAISGVIVQKNNGKLLVRGFDTSSPYFTVYGVIRNSNASSITVGGISSSYVNWAESSTTGQTGLSAVDTTTANAAIAGTFYQQGQIVKYKNSFYRVTTSHRSTESFNPAYFQILPGLPTTGGATVKTATKFDGVAVNIPYGTEFNTIQEVYDVILGYGAWLEDQGFIFDEYNTDLQTVLNWDFTGKEFLYWTTQNWANGSIVALSPFADQIKFQLANSVVDNIFNSFYDYSILKANAVAFPQKALSVSRDNGICTIKTLNSTDGIFFAKLNSVQKEHAIIFNNATLFNDTIYDIQSGYHQHRMKLVGFRTANWNGDYFSPGFVYDSAIISDWKTYTDYNAGDVVRFNGNYYSANTNLVGTTSFEFSSWTVLGSKPVAALLPNFDYKINQIEDFYSLDIDNFDAGQQQMAQHLTGYTPRTYLNNIFTDPIAQYKFYQGFIREKGTKNAISKLAKATIHNLQGQIDYREEWAFRVGYYGSFETFKELEVPLVEGTFADNPQTINFVDSVPVPPAELINYSLPSDLVITPSNYQSSDTFVTTSDIDVMQLNTAGYARFDDVNLTSFTEDELLTFTTTNSISEGSIIWVANKNNNDWDVLRYTLSPSRIISMTPDPIVNDQLNFVTDGIHGLSAGDIISVSEFDSTMDGIYKISSIPSLSEFSITSTSTVAISQLIPSNPGLLFTFPSVRYDGFDLLPDDKNLLSLEENSKVWVDNNGTGHWAVYEKIKNYNDYAVTGSTSPVDQRLGWSISNRKNSDIFLVGSPGFVSSNNTGSVFVYGEVPYSVNEKFRYGINSNKTYHHGSDTGFGWSVAYDEQEFNNTGYGLLFAGAPLTDRILSNDAPGGLRFASSTGTTSTYVQEGLVKISSISLILVEENTEKVLLSPNPSNYERFGSSIYQANTDQGKLLLVGATQASGIGVGSVYSYWMTTTGGNINIAYNGILSATGVSAGSQWGYTISGSNNAEIIAVGAPGYSNRTGLVNIFTGTATNYLQTINSPFGKYAKFGESISVSSTGDYLFISAPEARGDDQSYGKVAVYNISSGTYSLIQIINNPVAGVGMKFGQSLGISPNTDELVISAIGTNRHISDTFDRYSVLLGNYVNDSNSEYSDSQTTFDLGSTSFFDDVIYSGTTYVYNKKANLFKLADELTPVDTNTGTNFGFSVSVNANSIYVGAPAYKNNTNPDTATSAFYQFYKINTGTQSWSLIRSQDDLVVTDTIQKVSLIDAFNEELVDYLEVIDPVKGKISGLAEQELKYRSSFDPAVYSLGTSATVNDPNTNWSNEQVGELWWDLSTAKYVWYEQGEVEYRKNNWGKLFPGSSIDVYEWVESTILPSQWASLADTAVGLSNGISGQPKYPNNDIVAVKQIYNPLSDSFTNYYYFWVKNKTTVPNVKNRRISAFDVAEIITNPKSYGLMYISALSRDAVGVANVGNLLVDDRIHLNITSDVIDNTIPRHTEWLLLQEGSAESVPNTLLEKKLIDSLIGHDSLGNLVPDPALSERAKYGIGIRPRQTLFKNRYSALRNIIEFVNNVLVDQRITGNYSFVNLNKQEQIPDVTTHEYDQSVEDNEALLLIDTQLFATAQLSCTVENGKITSVTINNPGYGYKISPTVSINSSTVASISTTIDANGRVVSVNIENAGSGFTVPPELTVRPYTVIVQADSTYNGKWTKFIFDTDFKTWVRSHTQAYNTTLYWNYIDWVDSSYNPFVDIAYTIDELYELNEITVSTRQYVKVKNAGLGYYVILEKIDTGNGTFDSDYNIVYSQNGTIELSSNLWDIRNTNLAYDENTYDQTLYDQTPDAELLYILTALKQDLFVNDLKVNWNLLFFRAVKYALSEQKLLDWAFKTSFINVTNYAGGLDQRLVYKLQNSSYYEDYVNEVKPYHTQIRTFTTNYTLTDPSGSFITDFDLPAIYDKSSDKFITVDTSSSYISQYPWKSWADNYSDFVSEISLGNSGAGYTEAPQIIISDPDLEGGTTATAEAYVSSGAISQIRVINSGSGYITTPEVSILGGGSVITTATAYPYIANNKVRSTTIGLKFDRTSKVSQAGNVVTSDSFNCNGTDSEFSLTWLAELDKSKIVVTLDRSLILNSDYTIKNYVKTYNGYAKHYSKISFLNYVPKLGQVLSVTYNKSQSVLNAVDRIENYYTATSGMPGLDLGQLMTGIDYPKTRITGLMFDYTTQWDINGYDTALWDDNFGFYTVTTSTNRSYNTTGTSSTIKLSDISGVTIGQSVAVISTTSNVFSGTNPKVVGVDPITNVVTINTTTVNVISTGSVIEFWSYNTDSSVLDSSIRGGDLGYTTALGINPSDIIIDGDGFLTPNTSYAPEEMVPGEVVESLGINVYTKSPQASPVIVSSYIDVVAGSTTTRVMSVVPPNSASVMVTYNGTIFSYTATNITSSTMYNINWDLNKLIIPPQPVSGKLGYTIVTIGSNSTENQTGLTDSQSIVTDQTTIEIQSISGVNTVKTAYVTVNGQSISAVTTSSNYGYVLTSANNNNRRAAVIVYNLPAGENRVSVWFFGTDHKTFNEINEQIIKINTLSTATVYTEFPIALTQPPGNIKPEVANAIVDFADSNGRKLLVPPHIDYYQVYDRNTNTFQITDTVGYNGDTNDFGLENVRAYINGQELLRGFDFSVNSTGLVTIIQPVLNPGDVVAILYKSSSPSYPTTNLPRQDYEYDIIGNNLLLCAPPTYSNYFGWNTNWSGEIRVITYTDQDDMLMRTEKFFGNSNHRFKISRPVLDENYIWVSLNGIPLVNFVDFEILDDSVTVQISDKFTIGAKDQIVIRTFNSTDLSTTVLGYRIFNDLFNRTQFKRLSKQNTTYLTSPLFFTDTEINVADATVLTQPIVDKNIPGVVIIDGERIEFFKVNGNILGQLRRSTLGTAPKFYSQENTKVIDQGTDQTVPYSETILVQNTLTTTSTVYTISTNSNIVQYYTGLANTATFVNSGITLSTIVNATDQISVYYGGRLLNKEGTYHQDISVSYDSPAISSVGFVDNITSLPVTGILNTSFVVTSTNEVWVFENSKEENSFRGYVYKGLKYQPPEFTVNTSTQQITLNIPEGVYPDIKLTVVKRQVERSSVWNTEVNSTKTLSLIDSDTLQAVFLQDSPAELPDNYYYGGDPALEDDTGIAIIDQSGSPLEG